MQPYEDRKAYELYLAESVLTYIFHNCCTKNTGSKMLDLLAEPFQQICAEDFSATIAIRMSQ
jgi:hypothetical protein